MAGDGEKRIQELFNRAQQLPGFPREPGIASGKILLALFYLASNNPYLQEQACLWLQGVPLDQEQARDLGLPSQPMEPVVILKMVTSACALFGPVVIAFDQLDALVAQKKLYERQPGEAQTEAHIRAEEILRGLGAGLMAIPDQARRTLVVLSCLKDTWAVLMRYMGAPAVARFQNQVIELSLAPEPARVRRVLAPRIEEAAQQLGAEPEPLQQRFEGAFADRCAALTPREILQAADEFRRSCLKAGKFLTDSDLRPGQQDPASKEETKPEGLSADFEKRCRSVDLTALMNEDSEDAWGRKLLKVLALLRYELAVPTKVDFAVDDSFVGGRSYPTLHGRLRLIFREEGDREFHLGFRVLERTHPTAFMARLNASMIESGIDRALPYRALFIFRNSHLKFTGPKTQQTIKTFQERQGQFLRLPEETRRKVVALEELHAQRPPGWENWLATARPLSTAEGINHLVGKLLDALGYQDPNRPVKLEAEPSDRQGSTSLSTTRGNESQVAAIEPKKIFLGYREGRPTFAGPVQMEIQQLSQHVLIRAGSGGGKTVLIKRLVEEAALSGVSSVVLDPGNDLAQMVLDWETPPDGWAPQDSDRLELFRRQVEVVIYTPGRSDGRPLQFPFLPDLSALASQEDDFNAAVDVTKERLAARIAPGRSAVNDLKRGILAEALRTMAHQKRPPTLDALATLLESDQDAINIQVPNGNKLMSSLAGSIRSLLAQNPGIDRTEHHATWEELFGQRSDRTRISVINLVGLSSLQAQQDFVATLAESLFFWMRIHPSEGPSGISGLLVLDEAKDFLPRQSSPASRAPLMRLTAQARKYGVGLMFATQNPKDFDYNATAQFSTQYFGRANAPQVIEVIKKLLEEKGNSMAQPGRLERGQFYLCSQNAIRQPLKVFVPLCLTAHPDQQPLTLEQIVNLARRD
ncbi:MAG: DUF87 domain-containing protein [Verrucomicrobiia bacterium]